MKNFFALLFLIFFISVLMPSYASVSKQEIITTPLLEKMNNSAPADLIRINITLSEQFDSQRLISQVAGMDKAERRAYVVSVLKDFSRLSQEGVVADLNAFQRDGSVKQVTAFWIANVINCYATGEVIARLAERNDIFSIDYDEYRIMIDPRENANAYTEEGNPGSREITWNVLKINADEVWTLGLNGDGIIVAVIDTGVNYNHVDLADHVWNDDPFYPYHGYDFVNNDNNPMDDHGHGTHCAGTVAGDGTAGSQTGVAPEATIMCLKVLDAGGGGSESGVWAAVQFSVENGADVMSLSLGWQHAWGPNRSVWRATFDNSMASGIIASVAAGNEGDQQGTYPIPDNVRTPGDLPPAWLHPDQTLTGGISGIVCVGATDINDNLAGFSSRGPLDWSTVAPYNDYPYQPEMGLIRPDICAPGVNIKSLEYSSNTAYASGWSGTSMATPANAGLIALMLQKNYLLTPAEINQVLEETAVKFNPVKNNNSGSGRIDCLAAIEATPMPGPSYYSHSINDASGNNDGYIDPGESILLTLALGNFSDETADNVTVELSTDSEYITITDNSEFFGNFGLETIIEMVDAFAFDAAGNIPGGEPVKFNIHAYNTDESWESSFTIIAHGVNLQIGIISINDVTGNNNGSLDPGETADILIGTSNTGQIDALAAIATLTCSDPLITINTGSVNFGTIGAGQTVTATFNITVSPAAPVGSSVELLYQVVSGAYNLSVAFSPKIGLIVEDFETGNFSQFPWTFAGSQPWTVVSSGAYEGTYCAKSGTIGNNQSSEMKLTLEVAGNDTIAFFRKVSSEADYDFLEFYIDNVKKAEWAGEVPWSRVAYPVTEGEHTFRWVYIKDVYVVSGSDCAWVDYIELPALVDETMTVNAGADAYSCVGADFQTSAFAQNYVSLLWTSSGTGVFNNAAALNAIYTPSAGDYTAGNVTLNLTVYGNGGQMLTDAMILTFLTLPGGAGMITGDTWACMEGANQYSTGLIGGADWYSWVLTPATAGVITGNGTMVTVNWAVGFVGMASLEVQGMNSCGGGTFSPAITIQVDDCTGVGENSTKNDFIIAPNPGNGLFSISPANKIGEFDIRVVNTTGQLVYTTRFNSADKHELDLSQLNEGVYFIHLINSNSRYIEKLIIQK